MRTTKSKVIVIMCVALLLLATVYASDKRLYNDY